MTQEQINRIRAVKSTKEFTTTFMKYFDKEWKEVTEKLKRGVKE